MIPIIHAALPLADPVLIVAVASAVFLVVPLLFQRLRVPGLIGVIAAGAALGPHGLGVMERDRTIVLLGTVGLMYLMGMVGLELDLDDFRRYRRRSLVFGTLSFAVPMVAGTALAVALGYPLGSALLMGSVFSSHTLLAFPIAQRLGIVKNEAVTTTLGGTILTEILALGVLAFVADAARGGDLDAAFWMRLLVPAVVYALVVLWGLPRLGRWFFRHVRAEGGTEFLFVTASLFTVAYAAHFARMEPIVGALLAGLALNRLIPQHGTLMNRIHFAGNAIFIPFFLLSVGMLVNVRVLDTPRAWIVPLVLAGGVVATKAAAAWITGAAYGWSREERTVAFGLSVPHAAGTLAIVLVGFELGLFDQAEVNGTVVMILVTCLAGPWLVERAGRAVALAETRKPYDPSVAPRRILVPLANPATADELLDLALLLRGESHEPLHPLMVVGDADAPEAAVAEAERMLSHAVLHAAAAEVPVVPLTRVDRNVAAGIARGAAESRASLVVVGWDGARTGASVVFGSVLDQLLDETRQAVLVARLTHPVQTTRLVVLVLPAGAPSHPGFGEALRLVAALASRAGAAVHGLVLGAQRAVVEEAWAGVRPQPAAAWEDVADWAALGARLRDAARDDELTILLGARRGTVHWHPRLERGPALLAASPDRAFAVLYPPEAGDGDGASPDAAPSTRGTDAAAEPAPDAVVELRDARWETALGRLAQAVFPDLAQARDLTERLAAAETVASSEVAPGIVLPHTRVAGLRHAVLVLGVASAGIAFPHATAPVRLIFLLVSPLERPDEHLRHLARIARLAASREGLGRVVARAAPGTPLPWTDALHDR